MICPYCRTELNPAEVDQQQKTCEGCGTPHHQECFDENGGCTLFGCKFAPADEPKLHVNNSEISATFDSTANTSPGRIPPMQFTGFGDVMAAPAIMLARATVPIRSSATTQSVAPPPPPTSRTAPAPRLAIADLPITRREPDRFITPGGIFDSELSALGQPTPRRQPRNRMVYIMLGLFLGVFGAHSFYAGYKKRAIVQLCLTVLTVFYGALVTAIWTLVEVCTVDRDNDNVEFS